MTKIEYGKCEKLMKEAICKARQSSEEFEKSQSFFNTGNDVDGEVEQRKADQHYGEAVGIEHALATLGFKHDRMKELSDLL